MQTVVGIVDDNPAVLKSVGGLLRAVGYDTALFSSGEALLDGMMTCAATCLVIDVHLGGISGIELVRQLAALGLKVPIIFMSGAVDHLMERQAAETGCIALLHKPFCANLLVEAIERALRPA